MSKRRLPAWMFDNKLNESSSSPCKIVKTNYENIKRLNLNDNNIVTGGVTQPPRIRTPNEINNVSNTTESESTDTSAGHVLINELPANNTAIVDSHLCTATNEMAPQTCTNNPIDESIRNEQNIVTNSNHGIIIIKSEPITPDESTITSNNNIVDSTVDDVKPNIANIKIEQPVIKTEAIIDPPSSVLRNSCSFGIKCYRQNAEHRTELAHPGDLDYRRPIFPPAAPGTPACPWGATCYRRNPQHFQQLSHPPFNMYDPNNLGAALTNIPTIPPSQLPRTRIRITNPITMTSINNDGSDNDESEEPDPYASDGSADEYTPGLDLGSNDDDDDDDCDIDESNEFSNESYNEDEFLDD